MTAHVFYSEYVSCLFTMSEKSLKTWWVPYSNMMTCQVILDNDDESAQAMADIFELIKSQYSSIVLYVFISCITCTSCRSWQSFSPLVALISAFIHNFDIYIDITY